MTRYFNRAHRQLHRPWLWHALQWLQDLAMGTHTAVEASDRCQVGCLRYTTGMVSLKCMHSCVCGEGRRGERFCLRDLGW